MRDLVKKFEEDFSKLDDKFLNNRFKGSANRNRLRIWFTDWLSNNVKSEAYLDEEELIK